MAPSAQLSAPALQRNMALPKSARLWEALPHAESKMCQQADRPCHP